jgi:hypothetical protein
MELQNPAVPALTSRDCCFRVVDYHAGAGGQRRLALTQVRQLVVGLSAIQASTRPLLCDRREVE